MLSTRVIPTLLIRDGGLVKGERFRKHKYVGDPINAVKIFNDKEVDELIFFDIEATKCRKEPNYELIKDIASQAFMPLGYGGGINSVEQIERILSIGIEKVVMNTALIENPSLITSASEKLGSQSIVVSIDAKRSMFGSYKTYTHSGAKANKLTPIELAKKAQALGAGELIITSIDREGTNSGYDLHLVKQVAASVDIPVVASGGSGKLEDFRFAADAGASAVAAGDMFTFHGKHKAVLITYPNYDNLNKLFKG